MIGIYHSRDLDGMASGAIIKKRYPDCKMIGYDYGEKFPEIAKNEPVIMADVSFPVNDMFQTGKNSGWQFTWIDHHISSITDYKNFVGQGEDFCKAILDNSVSACEGCWKYFYEWESTPEAIHLLGEYDTWRNFNTERWNERVLPFQYGMRAICNSLETFPVYLLKPNMDFEIEKIIQNGKAIIEYQRKIDEKSASACSFEMLFEGYRAICLNTTNFTSETFKSVYDEEKHDLMMPFKFNGKQWIFSLYTTKEDINCSIIAKFHGGGGHKGAAGFEAKTLEEIIKIK